LLIARHRFQISHCRFCFGGHVVHQIGQHLALPGQRFDFLQPPPG
jgi:hypothetical protein